MKCDSDACMRLNTQKLITCLKIVQNLFPTSNIYQQEEKDERIRGQRSILEMS